MRRSLIFIIVFILATILLSCQSTSVEMPADFSLTYQWDSGSLPPQYHYAYTIQVDAQGDGKFTHQSGYLGEGSPLPWMMDFQVGQKEIQQLYALMLDKDIMRTSWEEGELLVGGQWRTLQINENNRIHQIPSDTSMTDADRNMVAMVYEHIESLVPSNIWVEMNRLQEEYENPAQGST